MLVCGHCRLQSRFPAQVAVLEYRMASLRQHAIRLQGVRGLGSNPDRPWRRLTLPFVWTSGNTFSCTLLPTSHVAAHATSIRDSPSTARLPGALVAAGARPPNRRSPARDAGASPRLAAAVARSGQLVAPANPSLLAHTVHESQPPVDHGLTGQAAGRRAGTGA